MSAALSPEDVDAAVRSLTGTRWAITDAPGNVPARPGLYAIYGDEEAWRDLDLAPSPNQPLYIGKAEDSLVARDLNGHFGGESELDPADWELHGPTFIRGAAPGYPAAASGPAESQ